VIVRDAFDAVAIEGTLVRAGGGTSLPVLARRTAAASLAGLEWAAGIPGSVGGGVRMNAGGHGSDTSAVLERARVVGLASGQVGWRAAADLHLGYRSSDLAAADVVVAAELRCRPGDRTVSDALIDDIVRWRRVNQPGGQNAGSVFTNPDGDSAGRLIDQVGMKGFRIGTAWVSTKHANFIQADEGGRAADVRAVMEAVRTRVLAERGIALRSEVRLVGFEAP
jgi:UDP-N-acetylmuramate dehydrogenase